MMQQQQQRSHALPGSAKLQLSKSHSSNSNGYVPVTPATGSRAKTEPSTGPAGTAAKLHQQRQQKSRATTPAGGRKSQQKLQFSGIKPTDASAISSSSSFMDKPLAISSSMGAVDVSLDDMEQKLDRLFSVKKKAAAREAFHHLTPYKCDSAPLRRVLKKMEERNVFPQDAAATSSVIALSNEIVPLLQSGAVSEDQHERVNKAFAAMAHHIHRLEEQILKPPRPEPIVPITPPEPLPEYTMLQEDNKHLMAKIESLEKQLIVVQESRKKQYESMQQQLHKVDKLNSSLKQQLRDVEQEKEEYYHMYVDKEKSLQTALVHLNTAQAELQAMKSAERVDSTMERNKRKQQIDQAYQRNSKYSAAQLIKLGTTVDVLREELEKERKERRNEKHNLQQALSTAEEKLQYSELVVGELRTQLAHTPYFSDNAVEEIMTTRDPQGRLIAPMLEEQSPKKSSACADVHEPLILETLHAPTPAAGTSPQSKNAPKPLMYAFADARTASGELSYADIDRMARTSSTKGSTRSVRSRSSSPSKSMSIQERPAWKPSSAHPINPTLSRSGSASQLGLKAATDQLRASRSLSPVRSIRGMKSSPSTSSNQELTAQSRISVTEHQLDGKGTVGAREPQLKKSYSMPNVYKVGSFGSAADLRTQQRAYERLHRAATFNEKFSRGNEGPVQQQLMRATDGSLSPIKGKRLGKNIKKSRSSDRDGAGSAAASTQYDPLKSITSNLVYVDDDYSSSEDGADGYVIDQGVIEALKEKSHDIDDDDDDHVRVDNPTMKLHDVTSDTNHAVVGVAMGSESPTSRATSIMGKQSNRSSVHWRDSCPSGDSGDLASYQSDRNTDRRALFAHSHHPAGAVRRSRSASPTPLSRRSQLQSHSETDEVSAITEDSHRNLPVSSRRLDVGGGYLYDGERHQLRRDGDRNFSNQLPTSRNTGMKPITEEVNEDQSNQSSSRHMHSGLPMYPRSSNADDSPPTEEAFTQLPGSDSPISLRLLDLLKRHHITPKPLLGTELVDKPSSRSAAGGDTVLRDSGSFPPSPRLPLDGEFGKSPVDKRLLTRYNDLVREYNELVLLYGQELDAAVSVRKDYQHEIHENAGAHSQLMQQIAELQEEKQQLKDALEYRDKQQSDEESQQHTLVNALQEELLQLRMDNDDLIEQSNVLKQQLLDAVEQYQKAINNSRASSPARKELTSTRSPSTSPQRGEVNPRSPSGRSATDAERHLPEIEILQHITSGLEKTLRVLREQLKAVTPPYPVTEGFTAPNTPVGNRSPSSGKGLSRTGSMRSATSNSSNYDVYTARARKVPSISKFQVTGVEGSAHVKVDTRAFSQLLQLVESEISDRVTKVRSLETDLVVKEKKLHDMENIAQMNQELVIQKDTQIRELEVQRSRKTETDAAVSNIQIASLKDQLEKTMKELNDAKAAYKNSNRQSRAITSSPSMQSQAELGINEEPVFDNDADSDVYAEQKAEYKELLNQQQQRKWDAMQKQPVLHKGASPLSRSLDSAAFTPHSAPYTAPSPRAVADSQESFVKSTEQAELEQRCQRAEIRCQLLTEQIQSMPESLSVAQAQKKVIEAQLLKATDAYHSNLKRLQDGTLSKINELKAYLEMERNEKTELERKLREQQATVHQLTHHMKLLKAGRASQQVMDGTQHSSVGNEPQPYHQGVSYADTLAMVKDTIEPAPWERTSLRPPPSDSNFYY